MSPKHSSVKALKKLAKATGGAFSLAFVPNRGPHRKLLPSLERYWDDDVVLVTVDDDKPITRDGSPNCSTASSRPAGPWS